MEQVLGILKTNELHIFQGKKKEKKETENKLKESSSKHGNQRKTIKKKSILVNE